MEQTKAPYGANKVASRIECDVQRVISLTNRVHVARDSVLRHTSSLGYYSTDPRPANGQTAAAPPPCQETLSASLKELESAVEELSAALNLFE